MVLEIVKMKRKMHSFVDDLNVKQEWLILVYVQKGLYLFPWVVDSKHCCLVCSDTLYLRHETWCFNW